MGRPRRKTRYVLAEGIDLLDTETWDALTRGRSLFMQRPFLEAFERAGPANIELRYALLFLEGRPAAALALQLVGLEGRTAVKPEGLVGMAQLLRERALVLGNLAAWGAPTGLVLAPGVDAGVVWSEALGLMDRLRRFEKVEGVVNLALVKDAGDQEEASPLMALGYQRAPAGPDMVLEVPWTSFDGYLASLASKRRRAVKKVFEDCEGAGLEVKPMDVAMLERHQARLDELYGQVWENAEVRPLKLSGALFVELKRALGEACVVTGVFHADRLEGFAVSLRTPRGGRQACVAWYLGFDRTVRAPLYLRLLLAVLEQGLAWKCEVLSFGRTAEEPKARLGAVPLASTLWVKHRTPPLNWALGAVLGTLGAPTVPEHRVFRESA